MAAFAALQGGEKWRESILAHERVQPDIPPRASSRQAVLMPVEESSRSPALAPRHRPHRRRHRQVTKRSRSWTSTAATKTVVTGVEMSRNARRAGRAEHRPPAPRRRPRGRRARQDVQPVPSPRAPLRGLRLHPLQGRGQPSRRSSTTTAVLLPNHDVTSIVTLPEGKDIVIYSDDTDMNVELIHPIAMKKASGSPIRRGPPRRGRRPRNEDPEVGSLRLRGGGADPLPAKADQRAARPTGQSIVAALPRRTPATIAGQEDPRPLKAYDHEVIDSSARGSSRPSTRTASQVARDRRCQRENVYCVIRSPHTYGRPPAPRCAPTSASSTSSIRREDDRLAHATRPSRGIDIEGGAVSSNGRRQGLCDRRPT